MGGGGGRAPFRPPCSAVPAKKNLGRGETSGIGYDCREVSGKLFDCCDVKCAEDLKSLSLIAYPIMLTTRYYNYNIEKSTLRILCFLTMKLQTKRPSNYFSKHERVPGFVNSSYE